MIRAILYDLDNTLLNNPMERFVPAYLHALSEHMASRFAPEVFIRHLLSATDAMTRNRGSEKTNAEVFDAAFFPALGASREELMPLFDDFYANRFPHLRVLTQVEPAARPLMEWTFRHGYQVAIATNPLFPLTAVAQRLDWAGVPADEFPYDLVTTYEVMHATKPHVAYYEEIAARLGRAAQECLVVGDDWEGDISPAQSLGMAVYWIAPPDAEPPPGPPPAGQGSLADFARWIQAASW